MTVTPPSSTSRTRIVSDCAGIQHPGGAVPGAGHLSGGDLGRLSVPAGSDAPHALQRMLHGPGRSPGPRRHLSVRVHTCFYCTDAPANTQTQRAQYQSTSDLVPAPRRAASGMCAQDSTVPTRHGAMLTFNDSLQ